MRSDITLIGMAGGAGTGKDWIVANVLQPLGFYGIGLADAFKVELVGKGVMTFEEAFVTKPKAKRTILQIYGTELGRKVYGDNVWIDTMWADIQRLNLRWGMTRFVTTDVRFANEASAIQERGGKVYRINAPLRYGANGFTAEQLAHESELLVKDGAFDHLFDGVIDNDPEVETTTASRMRSLLYAHEVVPRPNPVHAGLRL